MQSPILIYPGGGVPAGSPTTSPVYSQADVTQLVNGQSYIDVVFGSEQTTEDWVLVECFVVNTTDPTPLNIWPGIVTDRSATGFTLQLNGMPDSNHYYLHWAVSGVNITPVPASSYRLYGPAFGLAEDAIFTIALYPSTTVENTVNITLDDNGAGGSFSPPVVSLDNSTPSQTVTYTPNIYGAVTISATNDFALTDPTDIVYTVVPPTYTLEGPTTGDMSVESTDFTVELSGGIAGTVVVTPDDDGEGGIFTPASVSLTTVSPSDTFTYTPASGGTKTISTTNDRGLDDPGSLSYVSIPPFDPSIIAGLKLWLKADSLAFSDGASVGTWPDSSLTGYDLTAPFSYQEPIFKTAIVNGMPVLRFDGSDDTLNNTGDLSVSQPNTIIIVAKRTFGTGTTYLFRTNNQLIVLADTSATIYAGTAINETTVDYSGDFHIFTAIFNGGTGVGYVDGTLALGPAPCGALALGANVRLMWDGSSDYAPGDVAEVLIYNSALGATDRTNVEDWLKDKYAIP